MLLGLHIFNHKFIKVEIRMIKIPEVFLKKRLLKLAQPAFTCSKLTVETLEQGVKYFQS